MLETLKWGQTSVFNILFPISKKFSALSFQMSESNFTKSISTFTVFKPSFNEERKINYPGWLESIFPDWLKDHSTITNTG